ncbi:hypothetical protein SUGI_0858490 [Cryptomeria japonica]|nr:hypothetical protein SUGI_0858490 [Cryptomeria japonica]
MGVYERYVNIYLSLCSAFLVLVKCFPPLSSINDHDLDLRYVICIECAQPFHIYPFVSSPCFRAEQRIPFCIAFQNAQEFYTVSFRSYVATGLINQDRANGGKWSAVLKRRRSPF